MQTHHSLPAHWLSLARHTSLGVICDLDGTLLPSVTAISESRLSPGLADVLSSLATSSGVSLVILSGRPREDLEQLLPSVRGVWLVAGAGDVAPAPGKRPRTINPRMSSR